MHKGTPLPLPTPFWLCSKSFLKLTTFILPFQNWSRSSYPQGLALFFYFYQLQKQGIHRNMLYVHLFSQLVQSSPFLYFHSMISSTLQYDQCSYSHLRILVLSIYFHRGTKSFWKRELQCNPHLTPKSHTDPYIIELQNLLPRKGNSVQYSLQIVKRFKGFVCL